MPESILQVPLLSDLKAAPAYDGAKVLMVGKTSIDDGLGGFYRFDASSAAAEDATFLNVVKSTVNTTGNWVRIFQRAKTVGGGILVMNGGVKTFFITATTDANGEVVVNLTNENTSSGTAIFTEIWSVIPQPITDATGPATAVQSYRKNWAANFKTITYGFYKANALTVTIGLLFTPVASIGAGTQVNFRIEGI